MSATATSFDVRSHLAEAIRHGAKQYLHDLSFIPQDKLTAGTTGSTRPPLEFTAECAGFNFMIAKAVRGEQGPMPSAEETQAFYASINTIEKASEVLTKSADELASAIENLNSTDELGQEITAPWGQPIPLIRMIDIARLHMAYHGGQLNYIQLMSGDKDDHWLL